MNKYLPSNDYIQSIGWMFLMCIISNLNDIITKKVGGYLPGVEVASFRFLFSALSLLPFMLIRGKHAFSTRYPFTQIIRVFLLIVAMPIWCYGAALLPLTTVTIFGFTTPFFILFLSKIFLNEAVSWHRFMCTLLGFFGILVIMNPKWDSFNAASLFLIFSTILFSILDIISKNLLSKKESFLSLLFYSSFGSAILGLIPSIHAWKSPSFQDIILLFLLGIGANLILVCMFKAYEKIEISIIQPFRYFELILSSIFGILFFSEWPTINVIWGMIIISFASFYLTLHESMNHKVFLYKNTFKEKLENSLEKNKLKSNSQC